MAQRCFYYEGIGISVEAAGPGHVDWLVDFLAPHFGVDEGGAPDCELIVCEDAARFAALEGATPTQQEVDCFALDSRVIRLPLVRGPNGEDVAYDDSFRVFFVAPASTEGTAPRFELVTEPDNPKMRTSLMRVVREFAMNHCHGAGQLLLHASGVALGKAGFIIAGEKNAGKTTLMTHLLASTDVDFVSNDRICMTFEAEGVRMRGMPAIVTLRADMLDRFDGFRTRLVEAGYEHRSSFAELAQRSARPTKPWGDGRFGLNPPQFCQLMDSKPKAEAEARAILFPRVTGEEGTIELVRVAQQEAAERLPFALLGAHTWRKSSDFFKLPSDGAPPTESELKDLCGRLAAALPCYECRLGRQAYAGAAAGTSLVRELLG